MTEESAYALELNSMLESLRAVSYADVIKKLELSGFSSYDLREGDPLVVLHVEDYRSELRYFWLLKASAALHSVMEKDSRDYFSPPGYILVLIDELTPTRILETVHRYLKYRPPTQTDG